MTNDLTIRIKYTDVCSSTLSTALHVSFPLWGIIAPAVAVFILGMVCVPFVGAVLGGVANMLRALVAALAVALVGFRLNKLVEKTELIADKTGIELPTWLATACSARFVPWSGMTAIKAVTDSREHFHIMFKSGDEPTRVIDCSRLSAGELEQLLLAIQLWAPPESRDGSVLQLQETVKSQALLTDRSKLDPSYTALWEDELRRRFRQVSFLPLQPGATIRNGTIEVVRQLAMGGLSAIYLCQLEKRDLVVIKEAVTPEDSPPELKQKAEELFEREAMILTKLSHRNVVKVMDYFAGGGRNYMMLEYVQGQDLRQYVKQQGRLREAVVVQWAKQIASVLEYLHKQDPPVIHRDLTPDNIVVRDNQELVVIDFGAANEFIGNSTGTFVGKQCYIAPEQFRGKAVPGSDVYAFGCTLHFLLTGKDAEALSVSHPRLSNELVSQEMDAFVAQCTDPMASSRPDTSALVQRLEELAFTEIASV